MAERWADGPSRRLDRLLEAAGLRNVDLARAMDLDPSTISKYRSGERTPGVDELATMLEIARGSADEVLGLRPVALDPVALHAVADAAHRIAAALPRSRLGSVGKK